MASQSMMLPLTCAGSWAPLLAFTCPCLSWSSDYVWAGESHHSWACCRSLSLSTLFKSELLCGLAFPGSRIVCPPPPEGESYQFLPSLAYNAGCLQKLKNAL